MNFKNNKISIVITILNEKQSICSLLNSLIQKLTTGYGIIIVDGGSSDGTYEAIQKYATHDNRISVYRKVGNIAVGRNYGVKKSKGQILLFIDGGCVAHKNWLKEITEPFNKRDVHVVAGYYTMTTSNTVSRIAAAFHGVTTHKYDSKTFMPSARSLAIRKSTFLKIGGFNEQLYRAGEDTLLNYKLVKNNIPIFRAPKAIVYWKAPDTITSFMRKSFYYALGDAQTGIWWDPVKKLRTHNIKILSLYVRYSLFTIFFLLSLISSVFIPVFITTMLTYFMWSIWKIRADIQGKARLLIPFMQVSSDISVMFGFAIGLLRFPKISV